MGQSRREFLRTASATAMPRLSSAQTAGARKPPNVLLLLTDDQGYGDLSCHGNPVLRTPNLDRLHSESVRFTDFHAAPMCTPTRGQLLTGMDALHNRAASVTAGRAVIRRGLPVLPEMFAASGYATGLFGKWHVGDNYPYRPMDRGFDEAKYFLGWGLSSAPEFDNDYFNGRYRDRGSLKHFTGYCCDFWFSEAMRWMRERALKSEPFLCYLPTNTPHGPAWVEERYAAPYRRENLPAAFFGMIANLDENVGRLEAFLHETGLRENTIFIYMTDNGGTAGVPVFNAGMRARKTQLYDGGHRVPCFVRWPVAGLRSRDIAVPSQMQDILPTLTDLCGLKKLGGSRFDGQSLAELVRGSRQALEDRMLVVQYGQILKEWDSCVIWGRWRLVKRDELYDIQADPGQQHNVAAQQPEIVRRMRARYEKWWDGVEPTLGDFCPISLGTEQENPVLLSCSDWLEIYCDNVQSVLNGAGGSRGGPWSVEVEKEGSYDIAVARWPFERSLALSAPCPEKKMTVASLPAGIAFPIAQARLSIGEQDLTQKATPEAPSATFRVKLARGKTRLHGWFQDAAGNDLCGAYYASVRRL